MTVSDVVFDTWAWWEIIHATPRGKVLQSRYLAKGSVATSAYAVAELTARLSEAGKADAISPALQRIASAGPVVAVDLQLAEKAGRLRMELRRADRNASLADAVMLVTARHLGLKLVSGDPAFKGQPDVVR
jgi:predicted nucleic acid-binding protein